MRSLLYKGLTSSSFFFRSGRVFERVDELLTLVMAERPKAPAADPKKQHEAAREAAEKCIVLLKNDDNILPLKKDAKVAVVGDFADQPRYQGAGSSMVNAYQVDETLPLLREYFPNNIGFARGFERRGEENAQLEQEAVALAKQAECVLLYVGLPEGYETEGLDRGHMRLPKNQVSFIRKIAEANPHVVAVLSCGSAVEMPWINSCQALIYGCLGGEAAASAMLRVLSGEATPGGKLAETFALEYKDMPVSQYYPGKELTSEYREGIYVGYRYFETAQKPVRFPFGFGLSYTSFEYNNLNVNESGVSFDVKNTGGRDGSEIAQMYIGLPGAKIFRPAMELKGFVRVGLQAGESKRVNIPFDEYTFRYFNVQSGAFEVEGGQYDIMIGASCEDIRLRATLSIKGTGKQNPYAAPAFAPYKKCELDNIPDASFQALLARRIPDHTWTKTQPLGMNDTIRQLFYAKNPIVRLAYKSLTKKVDQAIAQGKPDLNIVFIYNMPFRGLVKLLNGRVTRDMAEDMLAMVNGHWHRGLGRLIKHFFHKPELASKKKA